MNRNLPIIKTQTEIQKMRESGRAVAKTLEYLTTLVAPGITTKDLDSAAASKIKELGGESSFFKYRIDGLLYPSHICVSVEKEVVHGIPGKRKLQEGEIVSLDCGIKINGWHADSAVTVGVGKVSPQKQKLMDVTYQSLWNGIKAIKPKEKLSTVVKAIENKIKENGNFGIVSGYGGHGIGRALHEPPFIPNHGNPPRDLILNPGLVIALEPMVNEGNKGVHTLADGWTVVASDGKASAHFEHTISVTETGFEVLTLRSSET